jgi:hypothetical protein
MSYETARREAIKEIDAFASRNGLKIVDSSDGYAAVELNETLEGCIVTWNWSAGKGITYFVVCESTEERLGAEHDSISGACQDAIQVVMDENNAKRALTPAEANAEIRRFVNENREPRTGEGHVLCCDRGGREYAKLCCLLTGCDLTWHGGVSAGQEPISFCVIEASTDHQVTSRHPTPEAAFDAALERVQSVTRGQRQSPHVTVPKLTKPERRKRIYVCHAYSADPAGNAAKVAAICRAIVEEGHLPIGPQLYLAAFINDDTERALAMSLCLELIDACDEVRVYGPVLSAGMIEEIAFAMRSGMRITHHQALDTDAVKP